MRKIDKDTFRRIYERCLDMAPVTDDVLLNKINQFNAEFERQPKLNKVSYGKLLDNKIADYLFSTYQSIHVTHDEKIVGVNEHEHTQLFDARDTKIHLEI